MPKYQYVEGRQILKDWAEKEGADGVIKFQQKENLRSIEGLPALPPE